MFIAKIPKVENEQTEFVGPTNENGELKKTQLFGLRRVEGGGKKTPKKPEAALRRA